MMKTLEFVVLLAGLCRIIDAMVTEHTTKDYCLDEKFTASCTDNDVIMIENALYGRMEFGSCVQRDYGYIGCKVDVTAILANKCSGRMDCEVVNFETLFASFNRCPQDLKSYLQASYSCKQMTPPLDPDHCGFGYVEPLPPSEGQTGFLSPTDTRWGKPTCPWRIEGRPGQYVNLTLHDYSYFGVPNTQQPAFCRQYLTVSDGPGSKPKTIMSCSHELRHRTIYISRTNELSLYFLIDQKENPNIQFLLEFQVEGCSVPHVPANSYKVDNEDNTVTIQCNFTVESWTLTCAGGKWQGLTGNCTARAAARTEHVIPLGVSIIIIAGVALLVCSGVLVVGFLVLYCRRRNRHKMLREENQYYATHNAVTNSTCILNARTKHASLEKSRTPYSPLTKTRTLRSPTKGGEYTHIWEVKHPIPVATPEVPKTHTFRRETMPMAKSSPTMTCARSPILPERHRDRENTNRDRKPTFTTFKPSAADPYGIPEFRGQSTPGSSHSSQSSPLYFEIDTQRRKATNHYST